MIITSSLIVTRNKVITVHFKRFYRPVPSYLCQSLFYTNGYGYLIKVILLQLTHNFTLFFFFYEHLIDYKKGLLF